MPKNCYFSCSLAHRPLQTLNTDCNTTKLRQKGKIRYVLYPDSQEMRPYWVSSNLISQEIRTVEAFQDFDWLITHLGAAMSVIMTIETFSKDKFDLTDSL